MALFARALREFLTVTEATIMSQAEERAAPISAEALRMSILQKEMEKMDIERNAREQAEKSLRSFTDDFFAQSCRR